MRRVLLVRHCESSGQAPDAALTERGRAQAIELAVRLASFGIDYVASSPYARARETIEPFASERGLPIQFDARLVERQGAPRLVKNGARRCVARLTISSLRRPAGSKAVRRKLAVAPPSTHC